MESLNAAAIGKKSNNMRLANIINEMKKIKEENSRIAINATNAANTPTNTSPYFSTICLRWRFCFSEYSGAWNWRLGRSQNSAIACSLSNAGTHSGSASRKSRKESSRIHPASVKR